MIILMIIKCKTCTAAPLLKKNPLGNTDDISLDTPLEKPCYSEHIFSKDKISAMAVAKSQNFC